MSYVSVREERRWRRHPDGTAALASGFIHVLIFALFLWSIMQPAPPPRAQGSTLSVFNIGKDPANGSTKAANIAKAAQQTRKRPKASDKPKADKASESDGEDKPKKPTLAIAAGETAPPPAATQEQNEPGEDDQSAEEQLALDQTGELAFGVRATGNAGAGDPGLAGAISAAIANQIRACWTPPTNLGTETATTTDRRVIVATFGADGALSSVPTLYVVKGDQQSEVAEPDAIEEAAIAALERCAPIKLPLPLYPYWQQVELELFPKAPHQAKAPNVPA